MHHIRLIALVAAATLVSGAAFASSITVEVRTKSGSPSQYSRVNAQACGIGGGQFREASTDSSGRATLDIGSNSKVCTVYIDGKANEGSFTSGGSYSFTTTK